MFSHVLIYLTINLLIGETVVSWHSTSIPKSVRARAARGNLLIGADRRLLAHRF